MVVMEGLVPLQLQQVLGDIQADGAVTQEQADGVGIGLLLGQQPDGVLIGRASQDGFRQGRLVVGKFRFLPDASVAMPMLRVSAVRTPAMEAPTMTVTGLIRPPPPVRRLGSCGRPR